MYIMIHDLAEEHVETLKRLYLDDPSMTLKELSERSEELIGIRASLDTVKNLSSMYRWGVEKRRSQMGRVGLPEGIVDEAQDMRTIIYDLIMDPEYKASVQEMTALIGSWDKVRAIAPTTKSAKTSRQRQMEATRRGSRKPKEGEIARRDPAVD